MRPVINLSRAHMVASLHLSLICTNAGVAAPAAISHWVCGAFRSKQAAETCLRCKG